MKPLITIALLASLAVPAAADVCRDYEQQKQLRDQCIAKEGPKSARCIELSDLDWSEKELAACKAKPTQRKKS